MSARPRIAILTHSTNPRGGVVHAMQLAEALHRGGSDVTLVAPALRGRDFPRRPRCPARLVPARPVEGTTAMVRTRIAEVAAFLDGAGFELFHAQDSITANALADLAGRGRIAGYVRTVHHLDRFDDVRLEGWQDRGVRAASALCCVSRCWQDALLVRYGRRPTLVGNGVDTAQFSAAPEAHDDDLRRRLGLAAGATGATCATGATGATGPVVLAMGGIEARKNTLSLLHAFLRLRTQRPDARLIVAGGATLLDHAAYGAAFQAALAAADAGRSVILAGVIADRDMPSLYRLADVLASVSRAEGFGLCALEAMASDRPVVLSDIAPFNQHFARDEALWADPDDVADIARALGDALDPRRRRTGEGPAVARRFGWDAVARNHLPVYARMQDRPLQREAACDA